MLPPALPALKFGNWRYRHVVAHRRHRQGTGCGPGDHRRCQRGPPSPASPAALSLPSSPCCPLGPSCHVGGGTQHYPAARRVACRGLGQTNINKTTILKESCSKAAQRCTATSAKCSAAGSSQRGQTRPRLTVQMLETRLSLFSETKAHPESCDQVAAFVRSCGAPTLQ